MNLHREYCCECHLHGSELDRIRLVHMLNSWVWSLQHRRLHLDLHVEQKTHRSACCQAICVSFRHLTPYSGRGRTRDNRFFRPDFFLVMLSKSPIRADRRVDLSRQDLADPFISCDNLPQTNAHILHDALRRYHSFA